MTNPPLLTLVIGRRLAACVLAACVLAACAVPPTAPPTAPPAAFPTMTPGQVVRGLLPTPLPANPDALDPAQAAAVRPFPTPNRGNCPAPAADAVLSAEPAITADAIAQQIAGYLSIGGSPGEAEAGLRQRGWIGTAGGFVRSELDLTGEGRPEVLAAFRADDGAVLAIFTCDDGRYVTAYTAFTEGVPQIVSTADLNYDQRPDLLFAGQTCSPEGICAYRVQVVSWSAARAAFVNLLAGPLTSATLPAVEDYDQDSVLELIVRQEEDGDAQTGPLRTGFTVYDWNGIIYTRSVVRLNPPRYRIQVIQQADAAFNEGLLNEAAGLYMLALNDTDLADWLPDDAAVLRSYALYRLLVLYAASGDPRAAEIATAARAQYPDPAAAPVYMALLEAFWAAYSATGSASGGCAAVNVIIPERPAAVERFARYGESQPPVAAVDLCPF